MKKIVIVGGGASGLVASIYGKKKENEVIVLDKNEVFGKKILATGNGRCNYWNKDQDFIHYHSTNKEQLEYILTKENKKEIMKFFLEIGILPKVKGTYYYPNSNQASSIRDALVQEAKNKGVSFLSKREVNDIKKEKEKFLVITNQEEILCDKVVLATGSYASLKEKTNGYDLAKKFHHQIVEVLPALVQLKAKGPFLKKWSGIRSDVVIKLYENHELIKQEAGEIQLTDYGISGICTFNLSHFVSRGLKEKKQEQVSIDFLPIVNSSSKEEFINWVEKRNKQVKNRTLFELFEGILNYKLVNVLLTEAKINPQKHYENLTQAEKRNLSRILKDFRLDILGTNDFIKAQVCSGGVRLDEINVNTFESKKEKNLYLIGEMLDVDGDCGGYNLSFCWISGMKCGKDL